MATRYYKAPFKLKEHLIWSYTLVVTPFARFANAFYKKREKLPTSKCSYVFISVQNKIWLKQNIYFKHYRTFTR